MLHESTAGRRGKHKEEDRNEKDKTVKNRDDNGKNERGRKRKDGDEDQK